MEIILYLLLSFSFSSSNQVVEENTTNNEINQMKPGESVGDLSFNTTLSKK